MIIRQARLEDFELIKSLYRQLQPDDPEISDGRDLLVYEKILASNQFIFFVGEINNSIVASCYLNLIPNMTRNASPYGIIENVITEGSLRNRGYGKNIVKHTLAFAWSQGCYKVMLQTGSKRQSTHEFYKSCGFKAHDKFAFIARP